MPGREMFASSKTPSSAPWFFPKSQSVDVWHLPAAIRSNCDEPTFSRTSYEEEVRQFKRRLLLRTLRECGWRKAESARTLGVARGYLHRLINQLDINQREDESHNGNGNGANGTNGSNGGAFAKSFPRPSNRCEAAAPLPCDLPLPFRRSLEVSAELKP